MCIGIPIIDQNNQSKALMIRTFEYKIPFEFHKSFSVILESGNAIPTWELVISDEKEGMIEWRQKSWIGYCAPMMRLYLKQQRPTYTLVTIYVNHPCLIVDPFNLSERMYKKLEMRLAQNS